MTAPGWESTDDFGIRMRAMRSGRTFVEQAKHDIALIVRRELSSPIWTAKQFRREAGPMPIPAAHTSKILAMLKDLEDELFAAPTTGEPVIIDSLSALVEDT